ncbi:MAG: hypothetical protein HUK23_04550 [Sphaerochaetaceae bacterium]|nr:hypothetical protein [Sphaerochaetaceae bacterium]
MDKKKKKGRNFSYNDVDVPKIVEPKPLCSICNQSIDNIVEAISESDGSYSHFDCVLAKLKEQYHVEEPDKISYIGHGNFAVVCKDETGHYIIKERIQYESKESYEAIKKFVEGTKA